MDILFFLILQKKTVSTFIRVLNIGLWLQLIVTVTVLMINKVPAGEFRGHKPYKHKSLRTQMVLLSSFVDSSVQSFKSLIFYRSDILLFL